MKPAERYKTLAGICLLVAVFASTGAAFGIAWQLGCVMLAAWAIALGFAANECVKDEEKK